MLPARVLSQGTLFPEKASFRGKTTGRLTTVRSHPPPYSSRVCDFGKITSFPPLGFPTWTLEVRFHLRNNVRVAKALGSCSPLHQMVLDRWNTIGRIHLFNDFYLLFDKCLQVYNVLSLYPRQHPRLIPSSTAHISIHWPTGNLPLTTTIKGISFVNLHLLPAVSTEWVQRMDPNFIICLGPVLHHESCQNLLSL